MHPIIKEIKESHKKFWETHKEFSELDDSTVIIGNYEIAVKQAPECDSYFMFELQDGPVTMDFCNLRRPEIYGESQLLCPSEHLIHALFFNGPTTWNVTKFKNQYWYLPVYRYSHSGVAYQTTPFNCQWDSGLAGMVYIKKCDFLEIGYAGVKTKTPAFEKQLAAAAYLNSWIEDFNDHVNNNYWNSQITRILKEPNSEGSLREELDGAFGFLGESGKIEAINACLESVRLMNHYDAQ